MKPEFQIRKFLRLPLLTAAYCLAFILFPNTIYSQGSEYSKVDTVWKATLDGYITMMPYVDDEITIVSSDMGKVLCLKTATGEKIWEYESPVDEGPRNKGIFHTIVCDEKAVYFNNSGTVVSAIDKKTGKDLWRYYYGKFDDDVFTRIIQTENTIILNTLVPSILCLDKKTGEPVWQFKDFKRSSSPAAVASDKNGDIYFTTTDSTLYCLDSKTGATKWNLKTGSSTAPFGPVVMDDKILVNRHRNKRDTLSSIECYKLSDHKLLWKKTEKPTLIFGNNDKLFSFGIGLRCWDAKTGKELWKLNGDFRWYTAPLFKDGMIYYHNRNGNTLWVIEEATGKIVKLYPIAGKTYTTPCVTEKFILFAQGKTYTCMKR